MAESSFIEFLTSVKEKNREISLLSADIQVVEEMKNIYLSSGLDQNTAYTTLECFREKCEVFCRKVKEIRKSIECITEQYVKKDLLEEKMKIHISILCNNLKKQFERFLKAKAEFLDAVDEKQAIVSSIRTSESSDKNEPLTNPDAFAAEHCIYTFAEPEQERSKSIRDILATLKELNTTSIELNEIINSSGFAIENAKSKLFYSSNATIGVNSHIEGVTRRRKRRRWFKLVGLAILFIVCGCVTVFFGKSILDFIIAIKNALK